MTMYYSLTISEELWRKLADAIFEKDGVEGAAYLVCGVALTETETRLLARDIVKVRPEHYLMRSQDRLSIVSDSYAAIGKRARLAREAVIFVHSHPTEYACFSPRDDQEDPKLMTFFGARASELPHGTMVFSSHDRFHARVWAQGGWQQVDRVRIIGRRFRFVDEAQGEEAIQEFFDRNVRAFGPDVQRLLRRLHIGVVGAGGTGSAVIEQLARLGVGRISTFDGEELEITNVTRVHGSGLTDSGTNKAVVQEGHIANIGLDTKLITYPKHITDEATAKHLRDCDVVFGCTDMQRPRAILVRLALRYLIPVFDLAVKVDAPEGTIRGIWGRITALLPGEACLFCRGRIDTDTIRAEGLPPEQRDREIKEGYIKGLVTGEPAVVMFTTAVAAQAVSELLHRLTGFMGIERQSSEVLMLFSECRMRTNRQPPAAECICQQRDHWGRGDTRNFLGMVW